LTLFEGKLTSASNVRDTALGRVASLPGKRRKCCAHQQMHASGTR